MSGFILGSNPDYSEDPYFFYCEYDGARFKVVGRKVKVRLLSLSRAFLREEDSEFIRLFLRWKKDSISDLLAVSFDFVLYSLATRAEGKPLESALLSFQFRILFSFLQKEVLKQILERDCFGPTSSHQEYLRYFAKEALGEDLPLEWERDFQFYEGLRRPWIQERDLALREKLKIFARVYRRDPSASEWLTKLLLISRERNRTRTRAL